MSHFKILHQEGQARVGQLKTAHGLIETPEFIPVGTQGAVKAIAPDRLKGIGAQVVLANTYHLMLRPGVDLVKKLGGIHKFMNWDKPIMTDSGGFQVFSLGVALEHGVGKLLKEEESIARVRLNKVTEEGVVFQSHIDGSQHILTAEKSIQLQTKLGADLIVVFDDLESPKYTYKETLNSLELTERWELRSLKEYQKIFAKKEVKPLLYGVTHGGVFEDLRIKSAKFVNDNFEGVALGGAHKDKKTLYEVVEWTVEQLDGGKPRHLLGIGEVEDLFECIERGIDLFDCAAPTRRARNGSLYVAPGSKAYSSLAQYRKNNFAVNIKMSKFTQDPAPIDPSCGCYTCQNFSRAYLKHLYLAREILYHELATVHNLHFIINLVKSIRGKILKNQFKKFKRSYLGS